MSYDRKVEIIQGLFYLTLLIVFCGGIGTCQKYQYDECLHVGHTHTYCAAQAAGCFSK